MLIVESRLTCGRSGSIDHGVVRSKRLDTALVVSPSTLGLSLSSFDIAQDDRYILSEALILRECLG
jgi:hypothetical protein